MGSIFKKETTAKKEGIKIGIILLCGAASIGINSLLKTINPKAIIRAGNIKNYSAFQQYATAAKIEDYGIYVLGIIGIIIILVGILKAIKSTNDWNANFAIVVKHILLAVLIWVCIIPMFCLGIERTVGAHRVACWCGPDYVEIESGK